MFSEKPLLIFLSFLIEVPIDKEEMPLLSWNTFLGRQESVTWSIHPLKYKWEHRFLSLLHHTLIPVTLPRSLRQQPTMLQEGCVEPCTGCGKASTPPSISFSQ